MSVRTSYKARTDAELIDEGLDCEIGSLSHTLASRLDSLPIHEGSVSAAIDDSACKSCSDFENQVNDLQSEVSSLESQIENLDMDRLIAGVKRAKEAVKQASDKVNYLLSLGDDDDE